MLKYHLLVQLFLMSQSRVDSTMFCVLGPSQASMFDGKRMYNLSSQL